MGVPMMGGLKHARRTLVSVFAAAALLTACGGNGTPTAPTWQVPQIAGAWSGVMSTSAGNVRAQFDLRQTDRLIAGTWSITSPGNDTRGNVVGNMEGQGQSATFTGTFSWDGASATGTRCDGSAPVSGRTGATELVWVSPGFALTNCTNPAQNVTWTMSR